MQNLHLDKSRVYLLLGSNLGESELILKNAIQLIADEVGKVKQVSSIYETAAWGVTNQPNFLNLAVEIETILFPEELLNKLLSIEEKLGRVRKEKWGARLIDIDIIFFENKIIDQQNLQIPHPEMQNRRFVLTPLAEIAPNFKHPVLGMKVIDIISALDDDLAVSRR